MQICCLKYLYDTKKLPNFALANAPKAHSSIG